jgi:hypothetical protein
MATRGIRMLVPIVVAVFALGATASASAAPVNVTGEWHLQENVFNSAGVYERAGTESYDIPLEDSEGNFLGSVYENGDAIRGKVTAHAVLFSVAVVGGGSPYNEVYTGTVASSGETMEGISASCPEIEGAPAIYEGTWTMSLPGATAPAPPSTVDRQAADALCSETLPTGSSGGSGTPPPTGGSGTTPTTGSGATTGGSGTTSGSGGTAGSGSGTTTTAPLELTYTDCENFAAQATAGSVPSGDYTGPEGAYGTKAERFVACEQLVSLSFVTGSNWLLFDTAGGAINELELNARWAHSFQTYIPTQDGWQAVAAQISPWSQAQYAAYKTGAADPPSPDYEVLARVTAPKLPKIRVAGSASARTDAMDLNELSAELGSTRAIAAAFESTVDRAGGAKLAGNTDWQGRQTRLAVSLAEQLSAGYTRLEPLVQTLGTLAQHAPPARESISPAQLRRIRAQIARSGLTSAERARLRALGFGSSQLAALVQSTRENSGASSQLESSPAALFSDSHFTTDLQNLQLFFHLWPQRAEVLASATLGQ